MKQKIKELGAFSVYVGSCKDEFTKLDDLLYGVLKKKTYNGSGTYYGYCDNKASFFCRDSFWGTRFKSVDEFEKYLNNYSQIEILEIF